MNVPINLTRLSDGFRPGDIVRLSDGSVGVVTVVLEAVMTIRRCYWHEHALLGCRALLAKLGGPVTARLAYALKLLALAALPFAIAILSGGKLL